MTSKLLLLIIAVVGFVFKETAIILVFGMMPTLAILATDKSIGKSRTICVGAMNFAGCFPFLLEFWSGFGQQTIDNAFNIISNVETIIVIYMLAAGGYAIDKTVTGITASIIIQKSERRLKKIGEEQKKLVERWGEKVTGQYKLDEYGFPIDYETYMRHLDRKESEKNDPIKAKKEESLDKD